MELAELAVPKAGGPGVVAGWKEGGPGAEPKLGGPATGAAPPKPPEGLAGVGPVEKLEGGPPGGPLAGALLVGGGPRGLGPGGAELVWGW